MEWILLIHSVVAYDVGGGINSEAYPLCIYWYISIVYKGSTINLLDGGGYDADFLEHFCGQSLDMIFCVCVF